MSQTTTLPKVSKSSSGMMHFLRIRTERQLSHEDMQEAKTMSTDEFLRGVSNTIDRERHIRVCLHSQDGFNVIKANYKWCCIASDFSKPAYRYRSSYAIYQVKLQLLEYDFDGKLYRSTTTENPNGIFNATSERKIYNPPGRFIGKAV